MVSSQVRSRKTCFSFAAVIPESSEGGGLQVEVGAVLAHASSFWATPVVVQLVSELASSCKERCFMCLEGRNILSSVVTEERGCSKTAI
jgi:hypothetical protein